MFTGIVEETAKLISLDYLIDGLRVTVLLEKQKKQVKEGDSIGLDGTCVTIEEVKGPEIKVFLSKETLGKTKFKSVLRPGYVFNVEYPLTPEKFISGHFVTGHIDETGKLLSKRTFKDTEIWQIRVSKEGSRFITEKASVAVDGVSLTVNRVFEESFEVLLIPYTLKETNFKYRVVGDPLNIEFDILAKYVEKFLKLKSF